MIFEYSTLAEAYLKLENPTPPRELSLELKGEIDRSLRIAFYAGAAIACALLVGKIRTPVELLRELAEFETSQR